MSSRVHPVNPRAFNLYYFESLVVSEANTSFLIDAADQAEKITMIAEYIQNLFSLPSSPAISV